MVDTPIRRDLLALQHVEILEELPERPVAEAQMIDADGALTVPLRSIWLEHRHISKREAVMFVVECQERDHLILELHASIKDSLIPPQISSNRRVLKTT